MSIVDDLADEDISVVIHLFDPSLPNCTKLDNILDSLAASGFQRIKFLRMNISKTAFAVDKIALPILQIYKGGDHVETITNVHMEVILSIISFV